MSNKKFTILTANYNAGRYLGEWADSILCQTYRPLEVIFVEDKSTDKSLEIIKKISKEFAKKSIDFKLVEPSEKMFCGSAYNLALRNANGSYFGVLDSDDMLESFAIEFIVDVYEKNVEVTWIYAQYNKYNRKMDRIIKRGFCKHPGKNKTILEMEKRHINTYGHWRTFSDRISSKKNLFGKGLKCCVDKHLGIKLEEQGVGMHVDKVCYKYRTRSKGENSIVHRYDLKKNRAKVVDEATLRRKNKKIYPILKYQGENR
jgi:glycosyltransferase involved in cell wall biosynthesis